MPPPSFSRFAPTLGNLERLLAESAAQPHREEVSKALREAVNRGGMKRFSMMEGPIKRGMPEIPSGSILDYGELAEPYSHLSARELQLPATPKGIERILPSLRSPNRTRETLDMMRSGADRGGHLWYNLRPLKSAVERERPDLDVASALRFVSPYSQSTPVDNEIMQGLFSRYFLKKHGELPAEEQISQALPPKYSAAGAGALERGRAGIRFEEGAQPKMTEHGELAEKPKLYPYDWARSGDVRNPVMDRHVLGHYGQQAGLKQNPKNALGLGMQYQALDAGMMPTEAQAALWTERLRRGYTDESGDVIKGKEGSQLPLAYIIERLLGESAESIEKSKMQHILDVLGAEDYPRFGPKKFQTGGLAHLAPSRVLDNIRRYSPRKYNALLRDYMRERLPQEFRDEPMELIKGGSGRKSFYLGDDKVVKIAQMPRGFAEMAGEGEPFLAEAGLLPKALWKDPNDEMAVLERIPTNQRAAKPWTNQLQKAIFNDSMWGPHALKGPLAQRFLEERDMQRMGNYQPLIGDFITPYHWGFKSDVMGKPLQQRRGTLLDPGAINPKLLGREVIEEYSPMMKSVNEERMKFLRRQTHDRAERRALEQAGEASEENPNIRLPGFVRGGPVKLAGGGDPARILMMLNRAQKALGTETTIRSGGQRMPLSVAAQDLRGLSDDQLRKIADIYSQGSRSGYRAEDLKAMIADENRNLGRIEELHDICQGPLGKRIGICFPERHFAGGGIVRNWLRGVKGSGFDEAIKTLKNSRGLNIDDAEVAATIKKYEEILAKNPNDPFAGGYREQIAIKKSKQARRDWIDRNLANYMMRQMGTEADPLLAGMGPHEAASHRSQVQKISAADVQRNLAKNVYRDSEEQAAEMAKHPWLASMIKEDNARAWSQKQYELAQSENRATIGKGGQDRLDHLTFSLPVDEARAVAYGEDSPTLKASLEHIRSSAAGAADKYQRRHAPPIELHDIDTSAWSGGMHGKVRDVLDYLGTLRPESLRQISVPQAFTGSRQWHAEMEKRGAADISEALAKKQSIKEYPGGHRWIELGQGDEKITQEIGKALGHCYQHPETCREYLRDGKLAALMKGTEPRATLELIPTGGGDGDVPYEALRKQMMSGPMRIGQVRGTQKIEGRVPAPMPEDLPYVQDFIRGGKWEGVGELENAGLLRSAAGSYPTIEEAIKHGRVPAYWTIPSGGQMRESPPLQTFADYVTWAKASKDKRLANATDDVLRENWLRFSNVDAGLSMPTGMAEGGIVHDDVFARAHAKYPGLPHGLLKAVAQAESNMNPKAVGARGEQGLMQFMPRTAKQYGVDPWDVESSVMGAGQYFTDISKRFKEPPEMLAAYNWGPGNLSTYGMEKAPKSTRAYISKVLSLLGNMAGSPTGRALRAGLGLPNGLGLVSETAEPGTLVAQGDTSRVDTSAQDGEDSMTEDELLAYLYGEDEEETA
jgi:hypothetical protein